MNQILTTKPIKPRKNVNLRTVILFFGICMIIFGICMASSGSYAMFINRSSHKSANTSNNTNTVEPKNSGIQIHLSVDGTNIKGTIVGETEISFVTYKWDDNDETREDINNVSGEVTIEIPEGEHTLTVTAIDINNNTKTESKQVKGIVTGNNESNENQSGDSQTENNQSNNTSKPKLEVKHDEERKEFVIYASDEKGLDKFEFILNGQGYLVRVEGEKEKQFRYPLTEGDNTLEVKAYNIDGATETFQALIHN